MQTILNPNMPKSNGHYAQCIEHNGLLYLSGQLPINPTDRSIPDGIEAQTDLVLSNLERILVAAGSDKKQVLQVRVYISDINLWDQVNERYASFFEEHKPVRCIIPTALLHFGCLIEVEVTALAKSTNERTTSDK